MPGKVIASYLVRIVLREPDALDEGDTPDDPPTIAVLEDKLLEAILDGDFNGSATVTAERTDR